MALAIGGSSNGTVPLEKPRNQDPFVGLKFWVDIDSVHIAAFAECSAITVETEVFEYAEGGENGYVHKLPVRTKYSNVTLKRGLDDGQSLYEWYMSTLNGKTQRKNITISLHSHDDTRVLSWHLRGAYPVKWTGPDLKADAGATTIESVEIAFDDLLPKKLKDH